VSQVNTHPPADLSEFFDAHPYLVEPSYDDSPFFWHFASFTMAAFTDFDLVGGLIDYEDAIGEKLMLILLGLVTVLSSAFLLAPFLVIREVWREMPKKRLSALYFASLGLGFMLIEVVLIQKFTLFLGYPTYSLSVTLFALLLSSGAGSALGDRAILSGPRAPFILLGALGVLVLAHQYALPPVVSALMALPLLLRGVITVLLIAPVGVCLGAFLPLGLRMVASLGPHPREYVAWAWAVNGFFSVIGSVLATIFAMSIGFHALLFLAVAVYAVGAFAISRLGQSAPPAPAA
jgi:hypothetical protein